MKATRDELIDAIPKNFPDASDPKYWYWPLEADRQFNVEKYWEAIGAWWYVVLNTEDENK